MGHSMVLYHEVKATSHSDGNNKQAPTYEKCLVDHRFLIGLLRLKRFKNKNKLIRDRFFSLRGSLES